VTTLMLVILAVWFVTLFLGLPIWLTMALAGAAFVFINDINPIIIPQQQVSAVNSFTFVAAPLFILMGNIMNSGGITERIFRFAAVCTGWMRGGLGQANILGSVIFAGTSGSAIADAGGIGTLEIKAMRDEGYDAETAAAITAASATIGPIIPPSIPMVVYGVYAEVSVGALFAGGIIPGLLMAVALGVYVAAIAKRRNFPRHKRPGIAELWAAFSGAFWALMTPVILFSGMLSGMFTPTEAAAVATFYALVLGLFVYREFRLAELPRVILETIETTGVVTALVMAAKLLAWCLAISRIPQGFSEMLIGLTTNPLVYLLIVNVILLIVGCFMEGLAAMLILVPILVPVAMRLDIDPVQFGLVFVLNLMIGTITPPVGVVLYVVANIAQISFERMSRAILPYLVPLLVVLAAITYWPPLTTFLPRLVIGR
jgi:tripartite ATP-independent transporter DctM subunit